MKTDTYKKNTNQKIKRYLIVNEDCCRYCPRQMDLNDRIVEATSKQEARDIEFERRAKAIHDWDSEAECWYSYLPLFHVHPLNKKLLYGIPC